MNKQTFIDRLAYAKSYIQRGFSVIPLRPKEKKPAIDAWKEYQSRRATEKELTAWFGNASQNNIGIVTGVISGIAVVDFDTEAALQFSKYNSFPTSPMVKTGKGYHAYYSYKEGVRNFQKRDDLPGIDLRGDGGYVVAPPSMHETGVVYKWVEGMGLDDLQFAELPEIILVKSTKEKVPIKELLTGASQGQRNDSLARIAGALFAKGLGYAEVLDLCLAWNQRNTPPLPELEVKNTVDSIFKTHQRKNEEGERAGWEEPLFLGEIETPELPSDLLPGFLGKYCRAVSESTQTPAGLAVMLSISTIAACLQKRFEVSPFKDDYTEPLSLWTVTALDPGNRKTAVKTAMTAPLMQWEHEQAELLNPKIKEISLRRDINLKQIDQLKVKAAKPDTQSSEREEYLRQIIKIQNETPDEVISPRLWTDDVTPERLQMLMADNGERIALLSDEGGIFEVMAGLYSDGRVNLNVFLQGHAGAPVRVDRQGRTVTLNKPALSFGLAVQPDIISDLAQGEKKRFRGNGTLARFLYCIPKSTVGSRDLTRRAVIHESVKFEYQTGVMALLNIDPVYDEHGQERARILTLTPDALQAWLRFSQFIESKQGSDGEYYSFQDWTSKLPGAALRIAGLFHVVEYGAANPVIDLQTIERALDLCELLISHARVAFDLMGADQAVNNAKHVFKWILNTQEPSFTQRDCLKKHEGRFKRIERLKKALDVLAERHIISEPQKRATGKRPGIYYLVNPSILNEDSNGLA